MKSASDLFSQREPFIFIAYNNNNHHINNNGNEREREKREGEQKRARKDMNQTTEKSEINIYIKHVSARRKIKIKLIYVDMSKINEIL